MRNALIEPPHYRIKLIRAHAALSEHICSRTLVRPAETPPLPSAIPWDSLNSFDGVPARKSHCSILLSTDFESYLVFRTSPNFSRRHCQLGGSGTPDRDLA